MYSNIVTAASVEHKTNRNNSDIWEVLCKDFRTKANGESYCAFFFKAVFWGSTKPCEEGEVILIAGDMVYNYWTDQNNLLQKATELRNPRILNMTNAKDETPQKEELDEQNNEEVPF